MNHPTIGFIGCGNMASAILKGALKAGYLNPETTYIFDIQPEKTDAMAKDTGIQKAASLEELARRAQVLVMAVKPHAVESVISQIGPSLGGKALLSIALGWDYARYSAALPSGTHVAYIMPNTPCMVGEGMALLESAHSLDAQELAYAQGLFSSIGQIETVDTALMRAAGTLSGCGPAFVYMMIEALADGAVYHGVSRESAYRLAAQMVAGAGRMVKETGMHPGALKDNVCSPGGSTIRGVRALEDGGFRGLLIDAMDASIK